MVKAGQTRRCQGLKKLGRYVELMRDHPQCFFHRLRFSNSSFVSKEDLCMSKNINFLLLF